VIKNIIFDFDGVILDSVPVKTEAFRKLFNQFPMEKVELLIDFHLKNGGMSRYKKIEYFFTYILKQSIENKNILEYAQIYSSITKEELAQTKYLIEDSMNFIKLNYKQYNMHIASGADEEDLKYICKQLDLKQYFLSIHGSPEIKSNIVHGILANNNYKKNETVLIGDSINDFEAANKNDIGFYGFNNENLKKGFNYIDYFNGLDFDQEKNC